MLDLLGACRGTLHVIDPFKVSVSEAVEKVRVLNELAFAAVLIGSTDCDGFGSHVPPYVDELRRLSPLPLLLHFPPLKDLPFSACNADAIILHTVPCALDRYFAGAAVRDVVASLRTARSPMHVLRSASFTFGRDPKSHTVVTSSPAPRSAALLKPYALTAAAEGFDIAYLYSRHGRVPLEACRLFRALLRPSQLLFVSGGVTCAEQVVKYLDAGADFVVFGSVLEQPDWMERATALAVRRGARHDCTTYATNFGRNCFEEPATVVTADFADHSLPATLRTLRRARTKIAVRGAGHSFGRRGLCRSGHVIAGSTDASPRLLAGDRVLVPAASTWASVETALNKVGWSVPVLTSELRTTVGGTLVTGGFGASSIQWGAQAHQVLELTMVLPDGTTVTAGPDSIADLFHYTLFGGGRLGIIRDAVLKIVTYSPQTWLQVERHPSLFAMVSWLLGSDSVRHLDYFLGQHFEGEFLVVQGLRGERSRSPPGEGAWQLVEDWHLRALREPRRNQWDPACRYLWADYVAPAESAANLASFIERNVLSSVLYPTYDGRILLLAMNGPERFRRFPFAPITASMRGLAVGFGVYFCLPVSDVRGASAIRGLLRRVLERCVDLGGRPYLVGWHELDEALRWRIWGDDYQRLLALEREYDPDSLFNTHALFDTPAP